MSSTFATVHGYAVNVNWAMAESSTTYPRVTFQGETEHVVFLILVMACGSWRYVWFSCDACESHRSGAVAVVMALEGPMCALDFVKAVVEVKTVPLLFLRGRMNTSSCCFSGVTALRAAMCLQGLFPIHVPMMVGSKLGRLALLAVPCFSPSCVHSFLRQ